jgi:hypothetical protein
MNETEECLTESCERERTEREEKDRERTDRQTERWRQRDHVNECYQILVSIIH